MIFYFLRFFVQIALKFYFRTIYFLGEETLPEDEPIIVAGNHSNSALDAIVIDAFLKKNKLYWLARGDIFNNKWLGKFMVSVRTAPIYRASDVGFVDIKRNAESFELCFDILRKNRMVGIFPEGVTIHERKLQTPFKKGFARLAFQAHEKLGRPIMIVPVGVSYHSLTKTRTDVFVKFGKAFSTELFYEEYKNNQTLAFKNIAQYLENQLDDVIISYDSVADQQALNAELDEVQNQIKASNTREFGLTTNPNSYEKELAIVNEFIKTESSRDSLKPNVGKNISLGKISKPAVKWNVLIISIFTIFVFIGKIIQFLPNELSKYIIKSKIKKAAFWGTVRFVLLYGLFPIYIMLLAFLASFISNTAIFIVLFLFPLLVYIGLRCESLIKSEN